MLVNLIWKVFSSKWLHHLTAATSCYECPRLGLSFEQVVVEQALRMWPECNFRSNAFSKPHSIWEIQSWEVKFSLEGVIVGSIEWCGQIFEKLAAKSRPHFHSWCQVLLWIRYNPIHSTISPSLSSCLYANFVANFIATEASLKKSPQENSSNWLPVSDLPNRTSRIWLLFLFILISFMHHSIKTRFNKIQRFIKKTLRCAVCG